MKRSRYSAEQIIGILKEHQAGMSAQDLCRKHGISDTTFYKWQSIVKLGSWQTRSLSADAREFSSLRPGPLDRSLKQDARLDLENARQLADHIDRGAVDAPLERADIGSVDTRVMGQNLLGQATLMPYPSQIPGEDLSNVHAREATALKCISPRSMLDNRMTEAAWRPTIRQR